MKKRKKRRGFTISAVRQLSEQRSIEMGPEELAQQTQVLVTGDPRLTVESGMTIANRIHTYRAWSFSPQRGYRSCS